jgi:hypothetical protein
VRDPTSVQLRKNGWKCSVKILITNFGSILFMSFYLAMIMIASTPVNQRSKTDCILYIMYSVVVPVFLSVFNPTVFVLFTPKTFQVAWNKICRRSPINDHFASLARRQTRQSGYGETLSDQAKVYQIGETSTVVQVKRISGIELESMVYSNFHTIRKETDTSVERVQSPVIFDLSGGADRQRRVSRFRSMEQTEAMISPVSVDGTNFVFSRSASANVVRRSVTGMGSELVLDTKTFPNVAMVRRTASDVDVMVESTTQSENFATCPPDFRCKPKTERKDETGLGAVAMIDTERKSEISPVSAMTFTSESKANQGLTLANKEVSDKKKNIAIVHAVAETIAEVVTPTSSETGRQPKNSKREPVLSNSDNMLSDSYNESEWEVDSAAEFSGLCRKPNNDSDKTLNAM